MRIANLLPVLAIPLDRAGTAARRHWLARTALVTCLLVYLTGCGGTPPGERATPAVTVTAPATTSSTVDPSVTVQDESPSASSDDQSLSSNPYAKTQDGLPSTLSSGWVADDSMRDVLQTFVEGFDAAFPGSNTKAAVYPKQDRELLFAFVFEKPIDPRVFLAIAVPGAERTQVGSRVTCASQKKPTPQVACILNAAPSIGLSYTPGDASKYLYNKKTLSKLAAEVRTEMD